MEVRGNTEALNRAREIPGLKSNYAEVPALLVSPPEAARITGIGVTRIRQAVEAGQIKARLVGSHTKIFYASLLEWVENLPPYSKADYSRRGARKARGHK